MNQRFLLGALAGVTAIVALPSVADAAPTCSYSASTRTMTVTATGSTVAVRNGATLQVSDNGTTFLSCAGAAFDKTDKVAIKASNPAAFQSVIIDETNGDFSDSNPKLRFVVTTGSGDDHLTIKETGFDNRMNLKPGTGLATGPAIDLDADRSEVLRRHREVLAAVVAGDGTRARSHAVAHIYAALARAIALQLTLLVEDEDDSAPGATAAEERAW